MYPHYINLDKQVMFYQSFECGFQKNELLMNLDKKYKYKKSTPMEFLLQILNFFKLNQ